MYCKFFGFSEKPFDVTPQPRFLYLSSAHREALASILYGLRATLDQLDEKTRVAVIINPELRFIDILALILNELGLSRPKEKILKVQALHRLNQFAIRQLAQNGNVVLMVDEAQHLSSNAMENLRLLSNLESRERKLIQIVLIGQPELDVKLSRHDMRQLAQRISLRRYIMPLSRKETCEYIKYRLQVAGYGRRRFFSDRALTLIWKFSRGVPRRINILCDNALLIAYARNKKKIKASVMKEAVKDLSYSPFVKNGKRRWFWFNRNKAVTA